MKVSNKVRTSRLGVAIAAGLGLCATLGSPARAEGPPFLPPQINSSTIPANGDVNPYGVAFVPMGFPGGGALSGGDVLVSNFNSSSNLQGTGTTIVQLDPRGTLATPGTASVFFTSKLTGLSTALGALQGGFVIVGNVPTTDGTYGTIGQGALQIIDRWGHLLDTWTDKNKLDGPWDLAIDDWGSGASVFVSNVLNGTVTRLDVAVSESGVKLQSKTTIATGYAWVPNAAAVVLGPTGLAFDAATGTLYVASTADNAIYAITNAQSRSGATVRGDLVFSDPHLRGPLALRFAPNGDLLTTNGDAVNADPLHPSEVVEFTRAGHFMRAYNVDSSQGGAFGFDTVLGTEFGYNLAVIDDVTNNLSVIGLH